MCYIQIVALFCFRIEQTWEATNQVLEKLAAID